MLVCKCCVKAHEWWSGRRLLYSMPLQISRFPLDNSADCSESLTTSREWKDQDGSIKRLHCVAIFSVESVFLSIERGQGLPVDSWSSWVMRRHHTGRYSFSIRSIRLDSRWIWHLRRVSGWGDWFSARALRGYRTPNKIPPKPKKVFSTRFLFFAPSFGFYKPRPTACKNPSQI